MLDAPHLRIHGKNQPIVATAVAQTFHDQHRGEDIGTASAVLLRDRQTEDAELSALLPILARELALPLMLDQPLV